MRVSLAICKFLALVVLSLVCASGARSQDGETSDTADDWERQLQEIKDHFSYDKWPKPAMKGGFKFTPSDFGVLQDYKVSSDSTGVASLNWIGGNQYQPVIERKIVFKRDGSESIEVRVDVCRDPQFLRDRFLLGYMNHTLRPDFLGDFHGATFDVAIGEVVVLHGLESLSKDPLAKLTELTLFRNNVRVRLKTIGKLDGLLDLAKSMDAEIVSQADAVTNDHLPSVTLNLAQAVVNPSDLMPGKPKSVKLKYEAHHDGNELTVRAFTSTQRVPTIEKDGKSVVDPDKPAYYETGSALRLDDETAPTKVLVGGAGVRGDYHVGIVAWDSDLMPIVAFQALAVKT